MKWNLFHCALLFIGGGEKQGKFKDTIDHCEGGQKIKFELGFKLTFELQVEFEFNWKGGEKSEHELKFLFKVIQTKMLTSTQIFVHC